MVFLNYILSPKLYKEYGDGLPQNLYETRGLEKLGDQIISTLQIFWNLSYYTSPLVLTFLYRRGYFVVESMATLAKFTTGIGLIFALSLCFRGIGRAQTSNYLKFYRAYSSAKEKPKDEDAKKKMRMFDFDFTDWPIDFDVNTIESNTKKSGGSNSIVEKRKKPFWASSLPCEIAAYIAMNTFGIRMIYPGSVKMIQNYLHPMLIQGRAKLVEEENGIRYKIKTRDDNFIDTLFIDNRKNGTNGKTLVICSEGNAGFYEIGIMVTPIELKYSVLGWNHPGFGGSTGQPYPEQDQNAIDAVMQFAIHKLGFLPENIIGFGWSIGAYSTLCLAKSYPDIKGIILDATFDDLLPLALSKMPESIAGITKLAIRNYVNLNNSELITKYHGPVMLIRRTEDEIICLEEMKLETNRGIYLVIALLKHRFPLIFQPEQIKHVMKMLSKSLENANNSTESDQFCFSLLMSYVSDNNKSYPINIGEDYTETQKNQMAKFLIRKHLLDFKSSHCHPLPVEYFQIPWDILNETDFVFT